MRFETWLVATGLLVSPMSLAGGGGEGTSCQGFQMQQTVGSSEVVFDGGGFTCQLDDLRFGSEEGGGVWYEALGQRGTAQSDVELANVLSPGNRSRLGQLGARCAGWLEEGNGSQDPGPVKRFVEWAQAIASQGAQASAPEALPPSAASGSSSSSSTTGTSSASMASSAPATIATPTAALAWFPGRRDFVCNLETFRFGVTREGTSFRQPLPAGPVVVLSSLLEGLPLEQPDWRALRRLAAECRARQGEGFGSVPAGMVSLLRRAEAIQAYLPEERKTEAVRIQEPRVAPAPSRKRKAAAPALPRIAPSTRVPAVPPQVAPTPAPDPAPPAHRILRSATAKVEWQEGSKAFLCVLPSRQFGSNAAGICFLEEVEGGSRRFGPTLHGLLVLTGQDWDALESLVRVCKSRNAPLEFASMPQELKFALRLGEIRSWLPRAAVQAPAPAPAALVREAPAQASSSSSRSSSPPADPPDPASPEQEPPVLSRVLTDRASLSWQPGGPFFHCRLPKLQFGVDASGRRYQQALPSGASTPVLSLKEDLRLSQDEWRALAELAARCKASFGPEDLGTLPADMAGLLGLDELPAASAPPRHSGVKRKAAPLQEAPVRRAERPQPPTREAASAPVVAQPPVSQAPPGLAGLLGHAAEPDVPSVPLLDLLSRLDADPEPSPKP